MSLLKLLKSKPIRFEDQDHQIAWLEYQVDRLKWELVLAHQSKLEPFMKLYKEKKDEADRKTMEINEKIVALRRKLRSGELDNKQYQKELTPLKKEKKAIASAIDSFVFQALDKPFPEHNLTPDEIEKYLAEIHQWESRCLLLHRPIQYYPTGVGLCVLDESGKVIDTYYGQGGKGIRSYTPAWDYSLLQELFPHPNATYALFNLYDGSIDRDVIVKLLQTCYSTQSTVAKELADKVGCDLSVASMATKNIRVFTPEKTYTLR